MTGLFPLLYSFITTAASLKVFPPENVSLGWSEDIYPALSWTDPRHSFDNCEYQINSTAWKEGDRVTRFYRYSSSPWRELYEINGGFINISIQTVCSGVMSEPVITVLNDPDLGLSCVIKSSTLTRCSWKPLPPSANVSFFYDLLDYDDNGDSPPSLRECPHYTDGTRTACHLQMNRTQQLSVLLNATLDNRTIRNVYQFTTIPFRLSPLNWTIKESKEHFHISWSPPEFSDWKYVIKYTECNTTDTRDISRGLSVEWNRRPECSYSFSMRGVVENKGDTEWTPEKLYDAVSGTNPMLFAVILIPLLTAVLVLLALIWCMKNKDQIYPKVPQPNPELFKDILNNNINTLDFCMPKMEEECHVSLVLDHRHIKSQL